MAFFEELEKPDVATQDRELANMLCELLLALGLISNRPKLGTWAVEFARLRKHHKMSEIIELLEWYGLNARGRFTPKALSAKSFRLKYEKMQQAMSRETGPSIKKVDSVHVQIMLSRLRLEWPPAYSKEDLEQFVFLCYQEHASWKEHLKQAPDSLRECSHVLLSRWSNADNFIEFWIRGVWSWLWSLVDRQEDSMPKLTSLLPRPRQARFRAEGILVLREYLGAGSACARLWSVLELVMEGHYESA